MYILVPLGGAAAGFINVLAGSGSLITLPLLMMAGLPPTVANGTNRVAIILQNCVAVHQYRKHGLLEIRHGLKLAMPMIVGVIIGAQIAVKMPESAMKIVIATLMVLMLGVLLLDPKHWLEGRPRENHKFTLLEVVVLFLLGIYSGFIQAGVGVFMLAGLVLAGGYDIIRANAVKLFIIILAVSVSLVIFVIGGKVNWSMGLLLAGGNMIGAWVGTSTAVRKGAGFVRWVLVAVVAVAAAKMIYDVAVMLTS